ncbi:uncharacterized protein LOC123657118 [Melitaea cinxia]|uniref:uncharacterized protein LOC123657118 n=1 Tax=Melitaea cinxia TaxID=113334 RepID=UPI001E274CBC|nr:uncharacterized protein LOC123657118 [Melitaea cinxia]
MENSLGSTIEKIKFQEQDNEAKLREKREFDVSVAFLNRSIRETLLETEKSKQEQKTLSDNISLLRTQVLLEKIRRDSLAAELSTFNKNLEDLRLQSTNGITQVWEQRSTFCKEIQSASDKYDVWALLMRPAYAEPSVKSVEKEEAINPISNNEIRLHAAIARRENALKERDRLKAEPDNGEEFLRIRNALRYSLEKIEELKQLK